MFEAAIHRIDLRDSMPSDAKPIRLSKEQQLRMEAELAKTLAAKRTEKRPNV